MARRNAYTVEFKLHMGGEIHHICLLAKNKVDAWDRAVYEEIPRLTGEHPYSAWVYSVTYQNGNSHRFNTHEGMPY